MGSDPNHQDRGRRLLLYYFEYNYCRSIFHLLSKGNLFINSMSTIIYSDEKITCRPLLNLELLWPSWAKAIACIRKDGAAGSQWLQIRNVIDALFIFRQFPSILVIMWSVSMVGVLSWLIIIVHGERRIDLIYYVCPSTAITWGHGPWCTPTLSGTVLIFSLFIHMNKYTLIYQLHSLILKRPLRPLLSCFFSFYLIFFQFEAVYFCSQIGKRPFWTRIICIRLFT